MAEAADPEVAGNERQRRNPGYRGRVSELVARTFSRENHLNKDPSVRSRFAMFDIQTKADVLGSDATKQLTEMTYDRGVGRAQVEVEQKYVLPPGVIHPYNMLYRIWWWITIGAALVTGWLIPYQIAFLLPTMSGDQGNKAVQAILLAIFCMDILISFTLSYYHEGRLVADRLKIIRHYATWRLWIDILTTVPWDYVVLAGRGLTGADTEEAHYIALLGLLKLGRMYRIRRLFDYMQYRVAVSFIFTTLLRNALLAFYVVNLGGCIFWYIARQEGFGPASWVGAQAALVLPGKTTFEHYLYSVYWSLLTFATVGSSNIYAISTAEVVWTLAYVSVNMVFWAYIIGSIVLLVFKHDERSGRFRDRMRNLELYTKAHKIPTDLKEMIQGHLQLQFTREESSDEALLSVLPASLRRRILRHLYGTPLSSCWLFKGVKPKFLEALLNVAKVETYMPMIDIVGEGDHVNDLYIVVAGAVESFNSFTLAEETDRDEFLAQARYGRSPSVVLAEAAAQAAAATAVGSGYSLLGPGDVFAEAAFFTEVAQLEVCRTLTTSRVLVIPRAAYSALCADFPQSARVVLENLQRHAESMVQSEFRGGAATRLLRGSIVAQVPGLTYAHATPETAGEPRPGTCPPASGRNSGSADAQLSLSTRQQQVVGNLMRTRTLVKHHVAQATEASTGQFLSAASRGEVDRVKLMLQQGFPPDSADYDGRTALMLAATHNHKTILEMLLSVNAKPNKMDNFGSSALAEAARAGHDGIISVLQAKSARLGWDNATEARELCGAVFRGDVAFLRRLLVCNADPNATDFEKRTPLHVAAGDGNLAAVRVLVEEGKARLDVTNRYGDTPLDEAREAQAQTVVDYLEQHVDEGTRIAARTKLTERRATSFLNACSGGAASLATSMLERGCPPDAADYDRRTGLMVGASKGHLAIVQLLLSAGANPNATDAFGGCALVEAAKTGRTDIIQALRGAKATLNLGPGDLGSALCNMVQARDKMLLRAYLAAGADVDASDYDKRTALHVAAAEGDLDMVQVLVEEGKADINCTDRWGHTPLHEATRANAKEVMAFLRQAAA